METKPIERSDFLALNFYKKTDFYGSRGNMNYRLSRRERGEEGEKEAYFELVYWPGPYNFAKTADNLKQNAEFPFSEEGIQAATAFLNEQYVKQHELWELSAQN